MASTQVLWKSCILIGCVCILLSIVLDGPSLGLGNMLSTVQQRLGHCTPSKHASEPRILSDLTYMPHIPIDRKDRTQIGTEKAVLLMLVRNFEVQDALEAMRQIEDRFNHRYKYPWVFLNDEKFTEEFETLTRGVASGHVYYGQVPVEHWSIPSWINQTYMHERMEDLEARDVIYGGSLSYRNMCRFYSGFFFRHPLLDQFEWYWRVEPGVKYYCDQLYDPFKFLKDNDKKYGFVITIYEYKDTVPTLWQAASEFIADRPELLAPDNSLPFLTDSKYYRPGDLVMDVEEGEWNLCHFWSNFEIANLDVYRSQAYLDFFDHLDKKGGFFYERWGDAPVHSLALGLLLNKSQIHHFADVGYKHPPYYRCPHDDASYISGRCVCNEFKSDNADFQPFSCLSRWWHHAGVKFLFDMQDQCVLANE